MKGAPGSLLGGRLGAVAPPASFNVQEVPSKKRCAATPLRVRVMGGGGGWFAGGLVGGRWGEVRWFWGVGGREGWFLRGMVLHFVFVWFCKRLHPKKPFVHFPV